jgi:hypothetical protein
MLGRLCSIVANVAIGLAVASLGTARAEGCLARVLATAERYGVATDPPTAGPRNPDVTVEELARSGGVVEPRRLKDGTVIAPPPGSRYGMATLPDIERRELPGIDLTALQAVLVAARAQAERGNDSGCWATLEKARTIIERER